MDRNPKYEIARADNSDDYENSGWVAIFDGEQAGMFRFGHCSCYGTWNDEACGGIDWVGTREEMLNMARERLDPTMPERKIEEGEYDYCNISLLYDRILEWSEKQ